MCTNGRVGIRPVSPITKDQRKILDELKSEGVDAKSERGRKMFNSRMSRLIKKFRPRSKRRLRSTSKLASNKGGK